MRLKINFHGSNTLVPINNNHILKSYINKCLSNNENYHGKVHESCVSQISGGKKIKDQALLDFSKGAFIIITSSDMIFINQLIIGMLQDTELGFGLMFHNFELIDEKFYDGWNHFATLSPFIIEDRGVLINGHRRYITLRDEDFQDKVEIYLKNKISKINPSLDLFDFKVKIDRNHPSHKVKMISVRRFKDDGSFVDVLNHSNQCFISIHTNKKTAELLYNIGIGFSTNIGFGTIYKTENVAKYRINY
jgi:CRISPR-associated endoribonuclease Cas6